MVETHLPAMMREGMCPRVAGLRFKSHCTALLFSVLIDFSYSNAEEYCFYSKGQVPANSHQPCYMHSDKKHLCRGGCTVSFRCLPWELSGEASHTSSAKPPPINGVCGVAWLCLNSISALQAPASSVALLTSQVKPLRFTVICSQQTYSFSALE